MRKVRRLYHDVIENHLELKRQMVFLPGPRQVGKTTLAQSFMKNFKRSLYLNWDNPDHQSMILGPLHGIAEQVEIDVEDERKRLIIFDEIHKYPGWKSWLKGFFDTYHEKISIIVTGSAMLNVYQSGGDSMMGRYFLYHVHPFTVAERLGKRDWKKEIQQPAKISDKRFKDLLEFGGFPEPLLSADPLVFKQWSQVRGLQLFREDLRDLTNIRSLSQVKVLAQLLRVQVGQNASVNTFAKKLQATAPTVKSWLETLKYVYYCFDVTPWSASVPRSLLKEPKYYLWDWSQAYSQGARKENFIACHLYKAVQFWTDIGLGTYRLHYLRDKEKREVDFIVTKDGKPWFLVEVKSSSNHRVTPALRYFFKHTKAQHAFQIAFNEPFADVDCFNFSKPIIVSAKTFLSQLV